MQMLYVYVLCASCGSLLMLVEDARGYHMEEAFSRSGLITALVGMVVYISWLHSCLCVWM